MSLEDRFNSFQKVAVDSIVRDFKGNLQGKYLLVIPTGGGKTFTAIKAVCKLFDDKCLDAENGQVLWVAHRHELLVQAKDDFTTFKNKNTTSAELEKNIKLEMVGACGQTLEDPKTKLVVIDEAHHAAATTYQRIVQNQQLGVLGLTATPSRHDGRPLEFERESYSIGFPDLVKLGIILRPVIRKISGSKNQDISGFTDSDLNKFDNDERNKKILLELLKNYKEYQKIIIYVGTVSHAKNLCSYLINSKLNDHYQSISYIEGKGNENSRAQPRNEYIETEKTYKRSIIINVELLTEGYDDPTVNTVLMAAPTKSKLKYMQAVGRAIRMDKNNESKVAYIVEIDDDLPNLRYRIDNRWLFSDISDALEPAVEDCEYSSDDQFQKMLQDIYIRHNVKEVNRIYPACNVDDRYSMLLFKQYKSEGVYNYFPLILDKKNRLDISNGFNFISERMTQFRRDGINYEHVFRMRGLHTVECFKKEENRRAAFEAMSNAERLCSEVHSTLPTYITRGDPSPNWIKFIALNYRKVDIADAISDFIKHMINRVNIEKRIQRKDYVVGDVLVKLPLPLKGDVGLILTAVEFNQVKSVVDDLSELKRNIQLSPEDTQISDAIQILGSAILPIEIRYKDCLTIIAKDEISYFINLID